MARRDNHNAPEDDPSRWDRRAAGWQVRCLRCGFRQHWGRYGIRKWAAGRSYTLGRCRRCGRLGCHAIEKPADPSDRSEQERSC
jgi:hypothetical protein